MNDTTPFISADQKIAELTLRSVFVSDSLTILLAMSNAYLALKLGILTSASILLLPFFPWVFYVYFKMPYP